MIFNKFIHINSLLFKLFDKEVKRTNNSFDILHWIAIEKGYTLSRDLSIRIFIIRFIPKFKRRCKGIESPEFIKVISIYPLAIWVLHN